MADSVENNASLTVKDDVGFANIDVTSVNVASGKRQKAVISGDSSAYLTGEDKTITVKVKVGNREVEKTISVNRTRLATKLVLDNGINAGLESATKYTPYGATLDFGDYETPEYEGYIFDGWYTDSDCTDEYSSSKILTEGQTLYAKWSPSFTISKADTSKTFWVDDIISEDDIIVTDNTSDKGVSLEWSVDNTALASSLSNDGLFSLIGAGTIKVSATYGNLTQTLEFDIGKTHTVTFFNKMNSSSSSVRIHDGVKLGSSYTDFRSGLSDTVDDVYGVEYTLTGVRTSDNVSVSADTEVTDDMNIFAIWEDKTATSDVSGISAVVDIESYSKRNSPTVTVSWTNPTDYDFSHIVIYKSGEAIFTAGDSSVTSAVLENLTTSGTDAELRIVAVDNAGNESAGQVLSFPLGTSVVTEDTSSMGKLTLDSGIDIANISVDDDSIMKDTDNSILYSTGTVNSDAIIRYTDDNVTYVRHLSITSPVTLSLPSSGKLEFNASTEKSSLSLSYTSSAKITFTGTDGDTFTVSNSGNALIISMNENTTSGRNQVLTAVFESTEVSGLVCKVQIPIDVVFSRKVYTYSVNSSYIVEDEQGTFGFSYTNGEADNGSLILYGYTDDNINTSGNIIISASLAYSRKKSEIIISNELYTITVYPTGYIDFGNNSESSITLAGSPVTLKYDIPDDSELIGVASEYTFSNTTIFLSTVKNSWVAPKDYYASNTSDSGYIKRTGYRLYNWKVTYKGVTVDFEGDNGFLKSVSSAYMSDTDFLNGEIVTVTPVMFPILSESNDYYVNLSSGVKTTISLNSEAKIGSDETVEWSVDENSKDLLAISSDNTSGSTTSCTIVPNAVGTATLNYKVGSYEGSVSIYIYDLKINAPDVVYDDNQSAIIEADIDNASFTSWDIEEGSN